MDMEELSKSQIVLLTLLVSFVTSIATGIVTVSLMDQAPPAIAQTVNRVIERTVEKVVPPAEGQAAAVVTTEKTIVVKESELIAKAVETMRPSLVRLYASSSERIFLGLGIVLDGSGKVAIDGSVVGETTSLAVVLSDGTALPATLLSRDKKNGIALLQGATTTSDGKAVRFSPAVLAVGTPTLGQTVVALSGKLIPRLADGLVTALVPREEGEAAVIDSNISGDYIMEGSPLINTEGGLLGLSTAVSRTSSPGAFMPSSALVPSDVEGESGTKAKPGE
ncbi:trypsin-like peptidase domain-containing protein [Candidatus Kaiserbacteria bacterium]|nr:trypsin-like peptidase domain-containing protein [Candidatus Kaiserbacteria bacterium]